MQPFSLDNGTKDISEELLWQILDESSILNNISFPMLSEFFTGLKIPDNNIMEGNEKLKKVKQKILDIIIDEKEECANYLILPKFKTMSESSKSTLKSIMVDVWEKYISKSVEDEKNKKYSRYFYHSDNWKHVEDFHIGIFQFLKNCYFMENTPIYRPMNNFAAMIPHIPGPEPFPPFSGMQMPGVPDTNFFAEAPIQPTMQAPSSHMQNSNSHMQMSNIKMEQKDIENYDHSYSYRNEPPQKYGKKATSHSEELSNFKTTKPEKEAFMPPPLHKSFLACVCKGKLNESERSFECNECKKKYHLTCLNIPAYATEKIGVQKQCPQCSMKNINALYAVIGDPLETFWSDDRELHKQKITIKSKKCKEILDKKYSIQLRFLKIEGKQMFEWDNQSSREDSKQLKKAKLNEVLIKDEVLNKGGGEDVKISLDCMKSPEDKNEDRKPILLFVALNIVKQKTIQEILETTYEYFDDDYLDQFLKDKEEFKIEIIDASGKLFKTPVRGDDCVHSDIFDLEEFAHHCIDLHSDLCFYCSKRCKTFKIDRKIENEIKRIKESIPNENEQPSIIYYQKNGTFKWDKRQVHVEEPSPNNSMVEDDISFPSLSVEDSSDEEENDEKKQKKKKKE